MISYQLIGCRITAVLNSYFPTVFLKQEHDLLPGERSSAAVGAYVGGLGPL